MKAAIKVLAFAGAGDVIGAPEVLLEVTGACTAGDVVDKLCANYPRLVPFRPILRVAVNGEYADLDARVAPGDEVALIPPVAGG